MNEGGPETGDRVKGVVGWGCARARGHARARLHAPAHAHTRTRTHTRARPHARAHAHARAGACARERSHWLARARVHADNTGRPEPKPALVRPASASSSACPYPPTSPSTLHRAAYGYKPREKHGQYASDNMHLRINDTLTKEKTQGILSHERLIGTMSATQNITSLSSVELASAVNATIAYLKARGTSDALARDMAQDAVLRAMRSPKRTNATWATYLITIARRLRIDAAKRHATRVNNSGAVADTYESIETRDALTRVTSNEGVVRLAYMLDALPEKQQRSLVLATLHGMSHGEIASVLGCSEGTVSWNISTARATLREKLSKDRR